MSKSFWDVAHAHTIASNKNSAMAVSGGLSYSPSLCSEVFELPPPYFLRHELPPELSVFLGVYGLRLFRLTALGVSKAAKQEGCTKIVCKCSCGLFALMPPKKFKRYMDRDIESKISCGVCSQNFQRIADERYGGKPDRLQSAAIWQRMGGA